MADLQSIEKAAKELARGIDTTLEERVGERVGFILWLVELNEGKWSTYVSNIHRDDAIAAAEELVAKLQTMVEQMREKRSRRL